MKDRIYNENFSISGSKDFWERRAKNSDLANLKSVLLNVDASDESIKKRNERECEILKNNFHRLYASKNMRWGGVQCLI